MGNSSPPRPVSRPCDPISEAQRRAHLAQHTATARLYLRASSEFSEKHFDSFELSDDEEANTALDYQRQHEAQPSPGPSSSSSPSPLAASSSPATSSSSSSSPAAFNRGKNPQIVILSQAQVASIQSNALKQMQAILGPELSLANVALLLQHFSWVSETLIEAYVADPEGTCRQAGVMVAPFDAAKDEEIMDHNRTELSKLHHVSVSSSDASTPAFSTFDPRAVALQLLPEVDSAPQLHLHDDDDDDDDENDDDDDENDDENDDLNSISSASSSLNSGLHDPSSSRLPEQVLQAILSDQRHSQELKYEQDLELLKIAHGELVDFTFARSLMEGDDAETQQLMDAQHASLVSSLISLLNSIPIHLRPPDIQLPSGVTPESTSTSSTTTTINAAAAAAAAIHEEEGSPSIDGLGFSTGDPAYQLVKSHYDAVMSPFWEERQRAILEESVALDTRRQKRAHRIRKRGVRAAVLPRSLREGSGASLAAEEGSLELSAKRGTPGRQYLLTSAEFPLRELAEEADTPVLATDMSSSLLSAMQGADPEEALTCSVCFADYLRKEGHSLACNHWFCTDCWSLFWESQLSDADNATFAKCMDRSCHLLVDKVRARQWLSAPQFARYERFFVHSFVQKNPSTVWCSSPSSCNNIALFTGPGAPPLNFVVLCTCGWHFCWHCKEAQHRPATCDQNQLWKQQMAKEGGAPTWVLQHTKACPGCSSPIEKNEGCLHMTCKCRHEFCWMCLGDWSTHGSQTGGYFKCNIYDPQKHGDLGRPKSDLFGRWVHHAERYDHHITAIQNARTFKIPQVQELAVRYEAKHPGWTGDFLMEALTVVIECRELLAYTYVASYALPDDYADRDLYQYLQGNLEAKTDQLNGFLTDFTEDSSDELSFKASVSATRKYFLRMSEAIERGLSTGYDVIQHPQSLAESSPSAKSPKWDWFGFLKRDKQ